MKYRCAHCLSEMDSESFLHDDWSEDGRYILGYTGKPLCSLYTIAHKRRKILFKTKNTAFVGDLVELNL